MYYYQAVITSTAQAQHSNKDLTTSVIFISICFFYFNILHLDYFLSLMLEFFYHFSCCMGGQSTCAPSLPFPDSTITRAWCVYNPCAQNHQVQWRRSVTGMVLHYPPTLPSAPSLPVRWSANCQINHPVPIWHFIPFSFAILCDSYISLCSNRVIPKWCVCAQTTHR